MKFNDEDENIRRTEEIVKTVAFFVVIIPVIFTVLIITVSSIFTSSNIKYMEKFYILDVNNENKSIIINLIEQEKENISSSSKLYCDSLYRIEYYNMFPDGTHYTIYCNDEENINFGIDKVGDDVLKNYIYENGFTELKTK
ncbi:MAG TPA: hypothetical protein IAB59_04045 [Candidatus Onthousia faecipullorum]|uniref:Uncharacterized protein n=1 Tax=Candidatus Onthousia faecipullorum TaxID=2840887 RepID=A0A9D1KCR7_9FIRM|nr:hypothetical protein [Candidatus Onthousia faecipullorum]